MFEKEINSFLKTGFRKLIGQSSSGSHVFELAKVKETFLVKHYEKIILMVNSKDDFEFDIYSKTELLLVNTVLEKIDSDSRIFLKNGTYERRAKRGTIL